MRVLLSLRTFSFALGVICLLSILQACGGGTQGSSVGDGTETRMAGVLVDDGQLPISGARLDVVQNRENVASTSTDSNGTFEMSFDLTSDKLLLRINVESITSTVKLTEIPPDIIGIRLRLMTDRRGRTIKATEIEFQKSPEPAPMPIPQVSATNRPSTSPVSEPIPQRSTPVPSGSATSTPKATIAAPSPTPTIEAPHAPVYGDVNSDGCVDDGDLSIITANQGMTSASLADGDITSDTVVDDADTIEYILHAGEGYSCH